MRLRIQINQADAFSPFRQGGCQVHRGSRFANASLLIQNGYRTHVNKLLMTDRYPYHGQIYGGGL
jgi:hypothetical protein